MKKGIMWVAFFLVILLSAPKQIVAQSDIDSVVYHIVRHDQYPECSISMQKTYYSNGTVMTETMQKRPGYRQWLYQVYIQNLQSEDAAWYDRRPAELIDFLIVKKCHAAYGLPDPFRQRR